MSKRCCPLNKEFVKVFCLITGILCCFCIAFGQEEDTTTFSFIRYDKNVLAFPDGVQGYQHFFNKLQTLIVDGEGNVNVMHIGGSHVQAGTWTEGLCESLRNQLPGLYVSRGLIFPYRAIGTTQPTDYIVSYGGIWRKFRRTTAQPDDDDLGVMGIAASTLDSNAYLMITAKPGSSAAIRFQKVKIFHKYSPATYTLTFPLDSLARITRDTAGAFTEVQFTRTMDTLLLELNKTSPGQESFFLQGLRLESEESGLCFDAIGNNGADLPMYLRCSLFEQQLHVVQPDLIILSVGINDAYTRTFDPERYKKNYRVLVDRIRAAAPDCAILFTTNNDSYYRRRYPNNNGEKVQQAIFELAAEYGAGVWDLYEVMGGARSINQWVSAKLAQSDRVHFTRGGYQLIGGLLSEALVEAYMEYNRQSATRD